MLAGRDEEAGGTWLAVNEHGLVAGLLHLVVVIAFARPLAAAGRAYDEAMRPTSAPQPPADDPAQDADVVPVSS